MANNPIPNDDLGEWGEVQFRKLCVEGRLVANKAKRDKMGWDFIVEEPPGASTPSLPLDQRPNGLACRVQVKAHWRQDDDRFEMTLSAAERLVKDAGPSFVVVLTAEVGDGDDDLKLVDAHLIHMLDDNLERVLKRLRESHADVKAKPLTKQKISYSPKIAGEQFLPKGSALRDALVKCCGLDPQTYIERKRMQLKTLGYTSGQYQLKTEIAANDIDQLVEMLLGLRPAPIEKLETNDVRFGVPILIDQFDAAEGASAEIEVHPPSLACTIRVRGKGLTPPAVFRGEVSLPCVVNIPDKHKRMLIKARFFLLDLRKTGGNEFKLEGGALNNAELNLEDWRNLLRLLEILDEGEVEFEIEGDGPNAPRISNLRSSLRVAQEPWVAHLAKVVRQGEALLNSAGAKGKAIDLSNLHKTAEMILLAHGRLFEPETLPAQTFRSQGNVTLGSLPDIDLLQVDCAIVAGVALAYATRLTMRPEPAGDGLLWRQVDIRPEKLEPIDKTVGAFNAFVAAMQKKTGLQNTIVRNVGDVDEEVLEE